MRKKEQDRLFSTEVEFVFWLANLLEASNEYQNVAVEPIIRGRGDGERMARADIMAVQERAGKQNVLIIECKNVSTLYGEWADRAIEQLLLYGRLKQNSKLVLAFPGNAPTEAAERIKSSGIELWDLNEIIRKFEKFIRRSSPWLLETRGILKTRPASPEQELLNELKSCEPGKSQWLIYQKLVGRIIERLFCPPLSLPISESSDESGVNRRDFILANFATDGFWRYLRDRYQADYIVIDAKNYTGKVKKRDVLQIANYLKPFGAGMFAIIFSRNGGDASARYTVREAWAHDKKLVLIISDLHCEAMLKAATAGDHTAVLQKELQDFRLSM